MSERDKLPIKKAGLGLGIFTESKPANMRVRCKDDLNTIADSLADLNSHSGDHTLDLNRVIAHTLPLDKDLPQMRKFIAELNAVANGRFHLDVIAVIRYFCIAKRDALIHNH